MRDSMHILDQLQQRGYEARGEPGDFIRRSAEAPVRVVVTDYAVRLIVYPLGALEWSVTFTDGTPSPVILAALDAAEREAGGPQARPAHPGRCAICGKSEGFTLHQGWADPEGGHDFTPQAT